MLSLLALLFAFICEPCKNGADLARYYERLAAETSLTPESIAYKGQTVAELHANCAGGTWCYCQHRPIEEKLKGQPSAGNSPLSANARDGIESPSADPQG